jgi:hypothetical protein
MEDETKTTTKRPRKAASTREKLEPRLESAAILDREEVLNREVDSPEPYRDVKRQYRRDVPPAKAKLHIHVHDEEAADEGAEPAAIRNARVIIRAAGRTDFRDTEGERGRTDFREIKGETDRTGHLLVEVDADTNLEVTVQAFGKSVTRRDIRGVSDCEMHVDIPLPVHFGVSTHLEGEAVEPRRSFPANAIILARADHDLKGEDLAKDPVFFEWSVSDGHVLETGKRGSGREIHIDTAGVRGAIQIDVRMRERNSAEIEARTEAGVAALPMQQITGGLGVGLRRTSSAITPDLGLWLVIRKSADAMSFRNYQRFMDVVLCNVDPATILDESERTLVEQKQKVFDNLKSNRYLPFTDTDAYRLLKTATEAFVMVNCAVALSNEDSVSFIRSFDPADVELLISRTSVDNLNAGKLYNDIWLKYLLEVNGTEHKTLPYLAVIASKFTELRIKNQLFAGLPGVTGVNSEPCYGILAEKLTMPCLVELIWSYWHEEAMLVQTMNAVGVRFQNRRMSPGDPLANMEIDPLRPLNNLLWGYIQDEQHRLSVLRRAYEYDHHYGLRLEGRAVPEMRTADSRSQFLQAFHHLLHLCSIFFQQDDDTTVISDGFPVLNALKEVHLILSQGAHNQFGDLPTTARIEMLMQEWILARPEFREFLPTRVMVAYPEPWMDRVDAMKKLQNWSDVNVLHFRDLGVFGEKLLLSIRYGHWVDTHDPDQAKNWVRYWRPEIQGYIHAYRAVTGVDVTAEPVNTTLPSILLKERLDQQQPNRPRVC